MTWWRAQAASPSGFHPGKPRRHDRAAAALEFAIVVVPFLTFLFAIFGAALNALYQLAFDEAVRNAARQIQIDAPAGTSAASFASAVCTEFGFLAPNCLNSLSYNVQASTPASGFAGLTPVTLSGSGQLANAFFVGTSRADNVNVLVQVAYQVPFYIPYFSTLLTATGTRSILATTTVRVEPY